MITITIRKNNTKSKNEDLYYAGYRAVYSKCQDWQNG
jgi:hypothetical protein